MIVKIGESRQIKFTSGTFDGISITVKLFAINVNDPLGANDWNPQNVQVKATLKRQKQTFFPINDNLQILGHFNSLLKGQFEFYNGVDLVYSEVAVKNVRLHCVKLFFGGAMRVNMSDELVVEVNLPSTGVWSSKVDPATSYVEFDGMQTIAYERGIWITQSEVVQQNITNQSYHPGDLVTDVALLNFDKDSLNPTVLQTINLSSDRLDLNFNFEQAFLNTMQNSGFVPNMRYSTTLPWPSAVTKAFRALNFFPQSFYLIGGKTTQGRKEVNKCKVDATFDGPQVAASKNYFVSRRFMTSKDIVFAAAAREEKHLKENLGNIPTTITGADYRSLL